MPIVWTFHEDKNNWPVQAVYDGALLVVSYDGEEDAPYHEDDRVLHRTCVISIEVARRELRAVFGVTTDELLRTETTI